jgi:uncharacterized membrane protein YphA (DoxX/SURF4 family)
MTHQVEQAPSHAIALLLARVSLGLYLLNAGMHKLFVSGQSLSQSYAGWMDMFHKTAPSFLPGFIATPYGYAFPWLEMLIGALLVLGLFFRVTTIAGAILLLSIYIAQLVGGGPFMHHSLVFALFSIWLCCTGPGPISLDALTPRRRKRR